MKKFIAFMICLLLSPMANGMVFGSETILIGKGTQGPYRITSENIISNSIILYRNGARLDSSEFSAKYPEGIIRFSEIIPVGDSIKAVYYKIPFKLKNQYYLREMTTEIDSVKNSSTPFEVNRIRNRSKIKIKGSKGFSVRTGQGESGLSQSLNLTIEGELVKGLRTSAHISDKSSGKSSASRKLNEIDKIFIEAESKNFKGIFGDFDYSQSGDGFFNFRRKLTGINSSVYNEKHNFKGTAAFFPGDFKTININGSDGLLGPYYLTDNDGRQGVIILAGSESVYLDGLLQSRGSQNDYIIDYEAGTIQFTPAIIIRDETRITIEYELSREEYSRSFYSFSGSTSPVDGLTFYSGVAQEGDNQNSPKSFELTDQNRQVLSESGDDRLRASKSGVVYAGDGNGDYSLLVDSSGMEYYVYQGPDLGDYDISFSFIGMNEGSYRFLGAGIYEFSGVDNGNYEPIILLPLPEKKRYGVIGSEWVSSDSNLTISGEMFGSEFDKNTVSEIDNIDNGIASLGKLNYQRPVFTDNLIAEIQLTARNIGTGILFPGRIDKIERYREYDISPDSSYSGEKLYESSIELKYNQYNTITGLAGFLSRPGIRDVNRLMSAINWNLFGPFTGFGKVENTSGERTWDKRSGGIRYNSPKLSPEFSVRYEDRDGLNGFNYYEYLSSIPVHISESVNSKTDVIWRDEQALDVIWRDKFESISIQQNLEFVSGSKGITGELNGAYYKKNYKDYDGTDSDQKSGWGRFSYSDSKGRGGFSISERLSSSNERIQARNFIFVGDGMGEYRFEDGEYINDPDGDYLLRIEEIGEGLKIAEIGTNLSWTLSPFKLIGLENQSANSIGRVTIDGELTFNLKKLNNDLTSENFVPWKIGDADDILNRFGKFDFRFYYYPPLKKQRIKYHALRSFQNGTPYLNETKDDYFKTDEISWGFPAGSKLDFLISAKLENKNSISNNIGYKVTSHKEMISADYKISNGRVLQIAPSYSFARQTDIDLSAKIPGIKIGMLQNINTKGRINLSVVYSRLIVTPEGSYIPYQMAGGKKEGDNFESTIRADIKITQNGKLETSYSFEKFASRKRRQSLNVEFKVLFL